MFQVTKVRDLEVQPLGPCVPKFRKALHDLLRRAACAVLPQLGDRAAYSSGTARDLGVINSATDGHGGGKADGDRIPVRLFAGFTHFCEVQLGRLGPGKWHIELVGKQRRQPRSTCVAQATDDDRRSRHLDRLGQSGAVGELVVATVEGKLFPDRVGP